MAFPLQCITQPASEPVSLSDMKSYLAVDAGFTLDDSLISGLISAARMEVEKITGLALVSQQWLFALDWFPAYRILDAAPSRSDYDALGSYYFQAWRWNQSQTIVLPRSPLISVDSVKYFATDADYSTSTLTTLDPSLYQVDLLSSPGRILPTDGGTWPIATNVANAVQVTFTAGFASPQPIPFNLILAIKLAVGSYYQNREDRAESANTLPSAAMRLINLDRTQVFGYVGR